MIGAEGSLLPGGGQRLLRRRWQGALEGEVSGRLGRSPQQERARVLVLTLAALPLLALTASVLQRIQHEHTPYLAESALGGLRKPQHPSNTGDCDRGQEHGANIISMSLYGGHNIYDVGALRNAKLAKEYMPGWRVRVYANASELRQEVIVELGEHGAELVDISEDKFADIPPLMWRFAVAADDSVGRYIIRDADGRLGARDAACVNAWVESCKAFHVIRDHPNHGRYPVGGGLWGGIRTAVPDMLRIADEWLTAQEIPGGAMYLYDMEFLESRIWPIMQTSGVLQHDSFTCSKWGASPFPVQRQGNKAKGFEFVGQKYDHASEKPFSESDAATLLSALPEPYECVSAPALPGGWRHL